MKFLVDQANGMIKIGETELRNVSDYKIEAMGHLWCKVTLTFISNDVEVEIVPPNKDEHGKPILPKSKG